MEPSKCQKTIDSSKSSKNTIVASIDYLLKPKWHTVEHKRFCRHCSHIIRLKNGEEGSMRVVATSSVLTSRNFGFFLREKFGKSYPLGVNIYGLWELPSIRRITLRTNARKLFHTNYNYPVPLGGLIPPSPPTFFPQNIFQPTIRHSRMWNPRSNSVATSDKG